MKLTTAIFSLVLVAMLLSFGTYAVNRLASRGDLLVAPTWPAQIAKLTQAVNALQSKVDRLQITTPSVAAPAISMTDFESLSQRIDATLVAMEDRMSALEDAVNRSRLADESQAESATANASHAQAAQNSLLVPSAEEQLAYITAVVDSAPADPVTASSLQTEFAQSLAASEFASQLIVDGARCAGRNCLVNVLVPSDQDPQIATELLTDEIPASYGGYSTFVAARPDGTSYITLYLQAN